MTTPRSNSGARIPGPIRLGVMAALVVTILWMGSARVRGDAVQSLTSWTTGLSGPNRNTSGTDRLLIFTAGMEADTDRTITSASYGGRPLTQLVTRATGTTFFARAYIFYLDEAGLQAATSNNFSVTWSGATDDVSYAARMYGNVDQNAPVRDSQQADSPSSTPNPITAPALSVINGDFVVAAAQCGNAQSYSWNNGLVEGTDLPQSSSDHSTADLAISSDGTLVASAQNNNPNRQIILAATLASTGLTPTLYYVRPDGNDSNTGDGPTAGQAWQSVAAAVTKSVVGPNDIVYVMAGTYVGEVDPTVDGVAGQPIRFIADADGSIFGGGGGNVILRASAAGNAFDVDWANYLTFAGFSIEGDSGSVIAVDIDNSTEIVFEKCAVYGCGSDGIDLSSSSVRMVNCLVHNNTGYGVEISGSSSSVTIVNSTLVANGLDGIKHRDGTLTVTNSIMADNGDDGIDRDSGTINHAYNLCFGNGDNNFQDLAKDSTEIESDPLFVDAAGGDYRLGAGSPAVNAGTNAAGTADDDLDGIARPLGAAWDIGCYEYALLGRWEFEDGGGPVAADSSGQGNDGTLQGSPTWTTHCAGNGVLALDGSVDDVVVTGLKGVTGDKSRTVTAWIQTSTTGAVVHWGTLSAGNKWVFRVQADSGTGGAISVEVGSGHVVGSTDLRDGRWHHVAAVLPAGATDVTGVLLYVDGELETISDSAPQPINTLSGDDVLLGNDHAGRYFTGMIDDVRIYGRPLTAVEISAMFGLVGHWRLDESAGNAALDSTAFANDGTLAGSPLWQPSGGKIDGALKTNGTTDYVDLGTIDVDTGVISMAAWFKADDFDTSDARIISKATTQSPGDHYWMLSTVDSGGNQRLRMRIRTGGNTTTLVATSGNLLAGLWYHAAAVYDGTDMILYLNGVEVGRTAKTGLLDTDPAVSVWIGDNPGPDRKPFDGLLDDVRVYARALCPDEIVALHGLGLPQGVRVLKWVEVK